MDYNAMADRDIRIADLHAEGATYAELSEMYGISRQRCHQIDEAVKRSRERMDDELYARTLRAARVVGTPHAARAYNAIVRHGMDVLEHGWDDIVSKHSVGKVTAAVVAIALGVEIPSDVMDELRLRGYMRDEVVDNDDNV